MSCRRSYCALALAVAVALGATYPLEAAGPDARRAVVVKRAQQSDPAKNFVGWVKPSSGLNIPAPFMLADRSGEVRYYLRPSAGVSLARYVHQRVRVHGTIISQDDSPDILQVDEIGPYDVVLSNQLRDDRDDEFAGRGVVRRASAEERVPKSVKRRVEVIGAGEPQPAEPEPQSNGKLAPSPDPFSDEPSQMPNWEPGDPFGDCDGPGCCEPCCQPCGWPGKYWVRGEYLFWFTQGMHVPPLVSTGPSVEQPGFIGSPGTTILFGDQWVNGYGRSGGRVTLGSWFDCCQTIGIEGDYFALANAFTNFSASSPGEPILSRPYFNTNPDSPLGPAVEQVASPGSVDGTVTVNTVTTFQSAGIRGLFNLCCSNGCAPCSCLPGASGPTGCRIDFLLGYRYMQLTDSLSVTENLNSLNTDFPGTFFVNDRFATRNVFNGIEFGSSLLKFRGRWSIQLLSKLALGINSQTVNINGVTTTDQDGVLTTGQGGLLALSSNIGRYHRNVFGVVPELSANVGYAITPQLRFLVGYTFIYFSQVVRAGD